MWPKVCLFTFSLLPGGVYVLDGFTPAYAGLQGFMTLLAEIRPKNDLGKLNNIFFYFVFRPPRPTGANRHRGPMGYHRHPRATYVCPITARLQQSEDHKTSYDIYVITRYKTFASLRLVML